MDKKIICILLVLMMAISCAACSSKTSEAAVTEIQEENAEVTAAEETAEEKPAEPEPTPVPIITVMGKEYPADTREFDLSDMTADDLEQVAAALKEFEGIEYINLCNEDGICALTLDEMIVLKEAAPDSRFGCAFELYGQTATDKTEELRYTKLNLNADQINEFRKALPFLIDLQMLRLGESKLDNDAMDELRSDFPNVQVIWSVFFVNHYWMTDTTLINSTQINDGNIENLRYMHDVLYLDFGHDRNLTTLDFVRNFPKLQVIICSLTTISDLTPLADCPELEFVETFSTRIHDLSPLSGLTKLEYLNVGDNIYLSDVTPLYGMTSLKKVRICQEHQIPKEQIEALRESIPDCEVNTYGGHSANSGHWRFDDDGKRNERYTLLREQMQYDLPWEKRQSNSPSELPKQ